MIANTGPSSFPLAESNRDTEEIDAIHRVIHSNMHSMGNEVAAFEADFVQFIGSKYCEWSTVVVLPIF